MKSKWFNRLLIAFWLIYMPVVALGATESYWRMTGMFLLLVLMTWLGWLERDYTHLDALRNVVKRISQKEQDRTELRGGCGDNMCEEYSPTESPNMSDMTNQHTDPAMVARAFEIADESMYAQLVCHSLPPIETGIGGMPTLLPLTSEDGNVVHVLHEADAAVQQAFDWLNERGFVRLTMGEKGERRIEVVRVAESWQ